MDYKWNSKTNCFDGYEPQYETKINEETGEEEQILIPCEDRLYAWDEVNTLLAQCKDGKVLKDVDGLPSVVNQYTEEERQLIIKKKRISELNAKLKETLDMAVSFANGEITEEKYAPIREQRKAWRAEIDQLEAEIG